MSEESTAVTEPVDDATVVHDDPVAAEEKADAELVEKVGKLLDKTPAEDGAKETEPDSGEEKPSEADKPKDEEPADLSDELKARAEGAGMAEELAQHLHQAGRLEETLAAFDRQLIERFSKDQPEKAEEEPERREETPPRREPADQEDATNLDSEAYNKDLWDEEAREDLVKRDAYHQKRIDTLEARIEGLLRQQDAAFDKKMDGMIDGLGQKDLFGKGDSITKDKQASRDKLFRAYQGVCLAFDVDPSDCDPQWAKRALAAMFPDEVFKQAQRQTVDRLRDAEGKFLSKSPSKGGPPPRDATDEEVHEKLVSDVDAYLKKHGAQMSGV